MFIAARAGYFEETGLDGPLKRHWEADEDEIAAEAAAAGISAAEYTAQQVRNART